MCYIIVLLGFPGDSVVKSLPANAEDTGLTPGREDPPEEEMATPSSILAWKIPLTGSWWAVDHEITKELDQLSAMAPHSSTLAWKIPWTEEPGRLQSTGSPGVGHD